MLLRTSQALILCPDNGQTIGFNCLKQTSFVCTDLIFKVLDYFTEWRSAEDLFKIIPNLQRDDLIESVEGLIDVGAVVEKKSADEQDEGQKIDEWAWGLPSAMFHYSTQDQDFLKAEEAETFQRETAHGVPSPIMYLLNDQFDRKVALPKSMGKGGVIDLMAQRRTERNVSSEPISITMLADCLFAGLGITGFTDNAVTTLPLSMTPSGGARNPFEAYVVAQNVTGLERGIYHYSAFEHDLGLVTDTIPADLAPLLGQQEWVEEMPAIIILCADLRRTMWKYKDGTAYKVVLMEAGHIAQNIMLSATEHKATACPTGALAHTPIRGLLGLDNALQTPMYALMLGHPIQQ